MYPLANDENGRPLDVPATAVGWLVRRHAGGKGRPGAVYDGEGRPLVVGLDATARELRAHGCGVGAYRLQAVDVNRRPLDGVVAFTEINHDPGGDEVPLETRRQAPDPAVEALARVCESMQRTQAERERAQIERERIQAEAWFKLIERIDPAPQPTTRNARDLLGEVVEVNKLVRKAADAGENRKQAGVETTPAARDDGEEHPWWMGLLETMGLPIAIGFLPGVLKKLGLDDGLITMTMQGIERAIVAINAPTTQAVGSPSEAENANVPGASVPEQDDVAILGAVLEQLTPDERSAAARLIDAMPGEAQRRLLAQARRFPPAQVAMMVRGFLKNTKAGPSVPVEKAA